jgi:hypothetical protein
MSKYDELTYKCRSELEQQMFPKCIRAKTTNVNDIQEEFKNMPIDKLKELMYLNNKQEKNLVSITMDNSMLRAITLIRQMILNMLQRKNRKWSCCLGI